jgi:hypothetical protein
MTDDQPQTIVQGATRVGSLAVESMRSVPLAIALLVVNLGFLGFTGYILTHVAQNANERNQTQMDLIVKLVSDIRDCRQAPKQQSIQSPVFKLPPIMPTKGDN